jgi:hypothetical protein
MLRRGGSDYVYPLELKRKVKPVSATTIRDDSAFEATMNAVIIYDRFDFAAKAKAMLERAVHGTGDATHWSVKPWRVDMLNLPPAAEVALAEAAEAHLIVLALRQVQSFFPWLADWLERWATCRQVQEAGLAVWDSENADTPAVRAAPELSQFAGRPGLSLLFDQSAPAEKESSMFASDTHERQASLTPTLQHIPEQPVRDYYLKWTPSFGQENAEIKLGFQALLD